MSMLKARPLLIGLMGLLISMPVWAFFNDGMHANLQYQQMAIELIGGLAMFLLGIDVMTEALKSIAGDKTRDVLSTLTKTPVKAALTGASITAVLQSSSVTTVLIVGFISANLMSLSQSVGIIMGANIGTTITAQIIAFKVTKLALPIFTLGFALQFFSRQNHMRRIGEITMGLGLIFLGMGIMSSGMEPLRTIPESVALFATLENVILAILVSAAFTALVQSSSATTGIVIVMASQGIVSLETGIAMILGANIGTCITAMLAAIGKPREAVRAAVIHVLFNVFGVLIWLAFIDYLVQVSVWVSPVADSGESLTGAVPRQIANAHTVFNVINTILFLPFSHYFAKMAVFFVPMKVRPADSEAGLKPRYLSTLLLDTPALAFDAVQHEIKRMGKRVRYMMKNILEAMVNDDVESLNKIQKMDDEVDALHRAIIKYLGKLSRNELSDTQTQRLLTTMEATNTLESIGDVIETDLVLIGRQKMQRNVAFSEATQAVLNEIHQQVSKTLDNAIKAVDQQDYELANSVIRQKQDIKLLVQRAYQHQASRLIAEEPHRYTTYRLEVDTVDRFKHIFDFSKRIAKTVMNTDSEGKSEQLVTEQSNPDYQ